MNLGDLVSVPIAATAVVAGLSSLGYLVMRFRRARRVFTVIDAVIMVLLMAIVSAAAVPLINESVQRAKNSAALENLYTIRSQIALYKVEHNGDPPLLYQGSLPQLLQATNAEGVPGVPGSERPCGPYLHNGIPANPLTGRTIITPCEKFPPIAASGNGGWLYQQETGQIAIDLPELINR